jgi:hypothetical protein
MTAWIQSRVAVKQDLFIIGFTTPKMMCYAINLSIIVLANRYSIYEKSNTVNLVNCGHKKIKEKVKKKTE